MKILFISHTYPPVTGGVETQNYELYTNLSKDQQVTLLANKKRWLIPLFMIRSAFRVLFFGDKYDVILLGSCLLGNIGWFSKCFHKTPVVSVAHGLDLTWSNNLYQKIWVGFFIPKLDKLIAVGNETVRVAIDKGISSEKIIFIPNGVDTEKHFKNISRDQLQNVLKIDITDKKVLLTSGRLAKRKGVAWFIENVMPKLPENVIYVVSGKGPDKENIDKAILKANMQSRVITLGYVEDDVRDILMNTCDLFVQPNIKVPGDMEGFGISVIEAASCKIPVIASRLEGLQDAIKDEKNGFLVEPENANAFAQKIQQLLADDSILKTFGDEARKFVIENYSWDKIALLYKKEIQKLLK